MMGFSLSAQGNEQRDMEWQEKGDLQLSAHGGLTASFFTMDLNSTSPFEGPENPGYAYLIGARCSVFLHKNWSLKSGINYELRDFGSIRKQDYISIPFYPAWHFGKLRRWNVGLGLGYVIPLNDFSTDDFEPTFNMGLKMPVNKIWAYIELDVMHNPVTLRIKDPFGNALVDHYTRTALNIGIYF